ncbi:MAG: hypothetical protein IKP88_09355, partial [Lachnospiraceae bacterium]|nr:hypothetical protein [Lachnospiraceae bacterium]
CKFGFIIERIREWEASGTYQSGIVFLFLDNTIYPDTVRNTTLNVDLYHLTRDDSPFMNPVIDPDLYELEKEQLFKTLYETAYPEDIEADNDYKYVWPLLEIGDAGFEIFSVSNGKKIKIFGAKLHIDDVDLLNMVELDLDEYLSIANELKNYVDHGYEEGYKN